MFYANICHAGPEQDLDFLGLLVVISFTSFFLQVFPPFNNTAQRKIQKVSLFCNTSSSLHKCVFFPSIHVNSRLVLHESPFISCFYILISYIIEVLVKTQTYILYNHFLLYNHLHFCIYGINLAENIKKENKYDRKV